MMREEAPTPARRGRWRSGEQSRRRILEAARECFGRRGYDRTTIRAIAAEADVDPAVIHYFFKTKEGVYEAAMRSVEAAGERIAELLDEGVDQLGPRLLMHFLERWDAAGDVEPLVALVRSAPTHDESAAMLRRLIREQIGARLEAQLGTPDAGLRVGLAGSVLLGVAAGRYLTRTEPLASADRETIVAWLGPVLQGFLTGPSPDGDQERGAVSR